MCDFRKASGRVFQKRAKGLHLPFARVGVDVRGSEERLVRREKAKVTTQPTPGGFGRNTRPPLAPKWVLAASGKGGSGKTTTSYNIAVQATLDGFRVLLVDLDSQQSLTRWHSSRPDDAPKIHLFSKRLKEFTVADVALIDSRASEAGAHLVVIDTPPGLDDWPQQTRELIGRADFVLVPTSPGGPDIDSVVEWMALLRREGAKASFVLNRTDRRTLAYEDARVRLNKVGLLCPIDIRRLADIEAVYRFGIGVTEMRGASGMQDIEGVWHYVRNVMGL